jgi:hypothetical protein
MPQFVIERDVPGAGRMSDAAENGGPPADRSER